MPQDRFLVGFVESNTGLQNNVEPWLIPDQAFAILNNAYVWRGRLRKRFGSQWMGETQTASRLRYNIGTVAAHALPAGATQLAEGQMFSVDGDIFTIYQLGNGVATYNTNPAITATIDTTVNPNTVTFVGAPAGSTVYWYPARPVMGIGQYEAAAINNEPTIAFDTTYAYQYNAGTAGWERLTTGSDTWTGTNADFFWCCNYQGATPALRLFFVTNFVAADGIRYWNGATWTAFGPIYEAPQTIVSARLIISFKNRLLLLNTIETVGGVNTSFVARCRFSGIGDATAANAWRQDIPGNGSAVDAATTEAIITAQFLKDRLIVYFERSTWELVYTGNQIYPFVWQKINAELGAESTFSQVPFDKVVLGIGNVGIHACTGANVERIDDKIPNLVYGLHNLDNGLERIAGIRDFDFEMVYWAYPDVNQETTHPYPNKVLVYNYATRVWSINDDSFTAFGFYNLGSNATGLVWGTTTTTWAETSDLWNEFANTRVTRRIVAGNQEGWTIIIWPTADRNAAALQVTDITIATRSLKIIDHNLAANDYILLENMTGITMTVNGVVVTSAIGNVLTVTDANNVIIGNITFTGTYTGAGTAARVSQIDIYTKQYNFYTRQDRNAYVSKIDFLIDNTAFGEISVDYFTSSGVLGVVQEGSLTGALIGNSILETSAYLAVPWETQQTRLWHPIYLQAEGECIQLRLYLSPAQMANPTISLSPFVLHAMNFYAQPTARRMQ